MVQNKTRYLLSETKKIWQLYVSQIDSQTDRDYKLAAKGTYKLENIICYIL